MLARLLLWLSGADKEYKKVKDITQKDSWINMEKNIKKMTDDLNKSSDDFSKKFNEYMKEEKRENITTNSKSVVEELVKLAELKQKGLLTEDEFNEQKKKLLKQ